MKELGIVNFFGQNIGKKILYTSRWKEDFGKKYVYDLGYPILKDGVWYLQCIELKEELRHDLFDPHELSDCQIIGKRTSQTSEEVRKHIYKNIFNVAHVGSKTDLLTDLLQATYKQIVEITEYLLILSYFPDKYFESKNGQLSWCVEV